MSRDSLRAVQVRAWTGDRPYRLYRASLKRHDAHSILQSHGSSGDGSFDVRSLWRHSRKRGNQFGLARGLRPPSGDTTTKTLDIADIVIGRQAHPDPGLALCDRREECQGGIEPLVEEFAGQ